MAKRRSEAGEVCLGWAGKRWAGVLVARRVTEGGLLIEGRRVGRLSRRGARRARCVRLSGA